MSTVVVYLEVNEPECAVIKVHASFRHGCVRILRVEDVIGRCPDMKTVSKRLSTQLETAVLLDEWHRSRPAVTRYLRTVVEPTHADLQTYYSQTMDGWLQQLESADQSAADEARQVLREAGAVMAQDLGQAMLTGSTELIPASLKALRLLEGDIPEIVLRAVRDILHHIKTEVADESRQQRAVAGYKCLQLLIEAIEVLAERAYPLLPMLGQVAEWCQDHELAHRMWRACRSVKSARKNLHRSYRSKK